ncbi:hypothetical protein D3C79_326440 [compost metagenome]
MSSEGLPVDGVVSVGVDLGPLNTEQAHDAAKSSLSADSAADSADAAFKFSRQAKDAVSGADAAAARAKISADKAENIADANTYYITSTDPDGTIAGLAGTPNGLFFRVMQGGENGYKYYRNDNGVAVQESAMAGAAAIAAVMAAQAFINSIFPQSLAIAAAGWMWGASNIDGTQLFAGIDSTGGLQLCDMPDAVQDRLRAIGDYETTSRTAIGLIFGSKCWGISKGSVMLNVGDASFSHKI